MPQVEPPRWGTHRLQADAERAIDDFRVIRGQEPLEIYNDYFDEYRNPIENLLEESIDLRNLAEVVDDYITDEDQRYALRYLCSPAIPIREKVLARHTACGQPFQHRAQLDRD